MEEFALGLIIGFIFGYIIGFILECIFVISGNSDIENIIEEVDDESD